MWRTRRRAALESTHHPDSTHPDPAPIDRRARIDTHPSRPLVSILTPSFNQARWLSDALGSVACQSYPSIEHIVMDGGSTDGTLDVLTAAGDSIRWRSEPDEGQSDAVNKAFAESTGDIIGWINSDDAYFDRHAVERVVDYFVAHPDVDVVYGHSIQVTADGKIIRALYALPYSARFLKVLNFIGQPGAFIRRSALTEPMLDASFHFAMDWELWLRLTSAGHRIHRINRIIAVDRHHGERKSETIVDVFHKDTTRLAEMYGQRYPKHWDRYQALYHIGRRILGALLIPMIGPDVAFTAPPDFRRGLWRRQVFSRRQDWPAEYR